MEIQQHDGVVVEAAGISAGLRQAQREGEVSREGEEGARGLGAAALPPPTIYRVPRGGAGPRRSNLLGGAAAKGGGVSPKACGAPLPPHTSVSTLGAGGGPRGAHQPTMGWLPSHFSPWGPPRWVAPPGGPPGPFRWSRYSTVDPRNSPDGRNCTSYI